MPVNIRRIQVFFEDGLFLRSRMHTSPIELDMVSQPWRMMDVEVIKGDVCTASQLDVLKSRVQRGPLSQEVMERRRASLEEKLSKHSGAICSARTSRFFQEIRPLLEKDAALAAMRARWANDRAHDAREHDKAAEIGAEFVVWPIANERRWPKPACAWLQHGRWFAMWRRSRRAMQAESRKLAQMTRGACKGQVASGMKRVNSTSSCGSWAVLSECSESSWQAVSECSDMSWLDLAAEVDIQTHIEAKIEEVSQVKQRCEKVLCEVMPALQEAKSALDSLCKADICEIKSMNKPPAGIVKVSEALCIIFNIRPTSNRKSKADFWKVASKRIWGDAQLMARMCYYDNDNIAPEVMEKLLPLESDPAFEPEQIKKASAAAYGVCLWVRALIAYDRLARSIYPEREALKNAELELTRAEAALAEKRSKVDEKLQEQAAEQATEPELPSLDIAEKAIRELQLTDLQEVKSLNKPPAGVSLTMEVLCIMLGVAPCRKRDGNRVFADYWDASRKLLCNPVSLLARMFSFKDAKVSNKTLETIAPYMQREDFDSSVIKKASKACEAICIWVRGMYKHHRRKIPKSDPEEDMKNTCDATIEKQRGISNAAISKPGEEEALDAMSSLSKAAIRELTSLAKPPGGVDLVCVAVMHLLAGIHKGIALDGRGCVKDANWKGCQKMLRHKDFFTCCDAAVELVCVGRLPAANVEAARKIVADCGDLFTVDAMKLKSKAAADLVQFVMAVIAYYGASITTKVESNISKGDIVELKSLSKPPVMVKRTLSAVSILLMGEESKWLQMVSDVGFLKKLMNFDIDRIPEPAWSKLQCFIDDEDFTPCRVKRTSKAAASLCEWVHAVYRERCNMISPRTTAPSEGTHTLEVESASSVPSSPPSSPVSLNTD